MNNFLSSVRASVVVCPRKLGRLKLGYPLRFPGC